MNLTGHFDFNSMKLSTQAHIQCKEENIDDIHIGVCGGGEGLNDLLLRTLQIFRYTINHIYDSCSNHVR